MSPSRVLYATAALLALSAAVHTGVWLADGSSWAGAVSWRKPIEFSASFAITLATLGWILAWLPGSNRQRWTVAMSLSVASVSEVALIAFQRWRGVASHFNFATPLDNAIFIAMGVFVAIVAIAIVAIFVWSLRTEPFAPDLRLAVRLGLGSLVIGQALGGVLLFQGFMLLGSSPVPSPVSSTVTAHAIALHGIQVLPVFALILRRLRSGHSPRVGAEFGA